MPKYRIDNQTYDIPDWDTEAIQEIESVLGVVKLNEKEEEKKISSEVSWSPLSSMGMGVDRGSYRNVEIKKPKEKKKSKFKKDDFKDVDFIKNIRSGDSPFDINTIPEPKKSDKWRSNNNKVEELTKNYKKQEQRLIANYDMFSSEEEFRQQEKTLKKDYEDQLKFFVTDISDTDDELLTYEDALNNLIRDPEIVNENIIPEGPLFGAAGLFGGSGGRSVDFLKQIPRIVNYHYDPYKNDPRKISIDNDIKAKVLDIASDKELQRLAKNRMNLEDKENLLFKARIAVINEKQTDFENEVTNIDEQLSVLTQGKMTITDSSDIGKIKKYNYLVKERNNILSNFQELQGQYGIDLATGIIKNGFKGTDELKKFNERYSSPGNRKSLADDLVSRFNTGIVRTVLKANPFTLGATGVSMLGSEITNLISGSNDYNVYDEFTDVLFDVADFNYFGTGKAEKFKFDDASSYARLATDMLPYTLGIIVEAKRGKVEGIKKLIGNTIGGKEGRLNGLSSKLKNEILVADAAFKVSILDNINEAKQLGLEDNKAKTYGFIKSLGTAITSAKIGIEGKFTSPQFSKASLNNFVTNLKSAANVAATKEAGKVLLKSYVGEILQEESEVVLDLAVKSAFALSLPGYENSIQQQKELIAGTLMLTGGFGGIRAAQTYSFNKKLLYYDVIKQGSDLIDSYNVIMKHTKDPKSLEQLKKGRQFALDIMRAAKVSPENVTAEQLELLVEKQKLIKDKEGVDSAFHNEINEKIKAIDEKISKSKVAKTKEDVKKKIAKGAKDYAKKMGFTSFQQLTQQEVDELIASDPTIEKEAGEQYGFFYKNKKGEMVLVENIDQSSKDGIITTGAHETIHAIVAKTIENNPEAAIELGQALKTELGKIDINNITNSEFKQRLNSYLADDSITDAQAWEEALTLFSEAALTGDIKYDNSLGGRLKDLYNSFLKAIGFKGQFDTGRDVYNFIKKFNKSLLKGEVDQEIIDIAKKGATGKLIDKSSDKKTKKPKDTKQRKGFSKKKIYDELQAIDELESNFTITPDSRARREELQKQLKDEELQPVYDELQAIEEYESNFNITPESKKRREELQRLVDDSKSIVKFSKSQVQNVNNLAKEYIENRNNKQLEKNLIDQYESVAVAALGYDVRRGTVAPEEALSFVRSQFKSIIDRFDPTKAAFTTHVNANIVPKRQQFYDQLIGDDAFTTSIDAPESRQIADTTPEVETTRVKEDKKPTTNPLKLFGLDEKAKTNFVEKTVKELKKLNVSELTYKTLRTLDEQGIADLVGIPAKKIFSPTANLSQPEARKALMFVNKNAKAIINLLPENNTEVKEVEAKNKPGKKVPIGGLPTGVPRNIQKLFYTKGKRIGNNFQFTKKKDITVESFKKALGIEGNVKSPTFKVRSSTSQALKGMLELIGRAATNTAARQYLQEIGTDPRIIENIGEGRNPVMFSKRNQDIIYNALSGMQDSIGKDAIVEAIAEEIKTNPKLINNTEYLEGVISVALEDAVLAGKEGVKFTKETNNLPYYSLLNKKKLPFLKNTESLKTIGKRRLKPENTKDVNEFIGHALTLAEAIPTEGKILLGKTKSFIPGALLGYHTRTTGDGKLGDFYKALSKNTNAEWISPKTKELLDKVKTIIPASRFKNIQKKISEAKTEKEQIKIAKQNLPLLREHQESAKNFFNAFNSLLKDYLYSSKNQKELESRLDYILKLKRANSDNVKGERDLVILDGFYLGDPDGPIKLEHVKSSSQQSVQSLKSIVSGTWDMSIADDFKGMLGYKNKFDKIDAYGKTNTSKYYRFYDKNEASKYILSEFGFEGTVYDKNLISAIQEDLIKSEKLAAPFNNEKLPSVVKFSKRQDYTNDMVLGRMAELDLEQAEAQIKFSKSQNLSDDFNKIIENKTGIGAEKVYSDVKAQVVGASKGRFNFFIPSSAEDFMGLLYKTLGKGKLGDAQMAWYKKNLLDPFARAMDNISRDRIALQNDFKKLKQDLKIVPKNLRKKIPGEFYTQEQAVRVYIWNQQGMTPEGMSQTDINELVSFVESKPELVTFANELIRLQKGDSYPAPRYGWLAGTITTDLMDGINTIKRPKYLEQWQYNADEIFSNANLNKLEAAYGKGYRDALENILKRMRTGRNREFNSDTLTGRVTDWLTNSVGAIMFFNTRSAVLQTISAVNFINFKDNNIFAAGKAFANQPQFWKDFMTLMNSDFLLDRRNGLRLNVNENDIADMAKKGGVRGVISEMLRLGFLPTQIADSFAIASGGATFYRNRIKSLQKQGMTKAEAEKQAFVDFREIAEESQQSSRPDKISQQQASPLGRVILAFANTPMQYARLIKKAASDIKNNRGDTKTNISKILYYGFVQNLLFNAMQRALFALGFGDEEDEDKKNKKYVDVVNSMADSILRGLGIGGAIFSVLKNAALAIAEESGKKQPKYEDKVTKALLQISPPLSSKVSKVQSAFRTYDWNKKEIMEKGWSLDNPAYLAAGQVISAGFNIPLDRAFKKIDNIRKASSSDYEAWARVAMAAGWADWELGVKKQDAKPKKFYAPSRKTRKTRKKRKTK